MHRFAIYYLFLPTFPLLRDFLTKCLNLSVTYLGECDLLQWVLDQFLHDLHWSEWSFFFHCQLYIKTKMSNKVFQTAIKYYDPPSFRAQPQNGYTEKKKREPKWLSWRVILKIGSLLKRRAVFFLHNHVFCSETALL